uniref:guanylate cyclase n=1 Tax=Pyramimonas obovata TaxID=1411642 RepID=A0A7S0MXQ9_9CHLO
MASDDEKTDILASSSSRQHGVFEMGKDEMSELRMHAAIGSFKSFNKQASKIKKSQSAIMLRDSKVHISGDNKRGEDEHSERKAAPLSLTALRKEIKLIKKLQHNNLIRYYGWSKTTSSGPVVVYEYLEGSLHNIIHNPTVKLDHEILLTISKNIASALHYMHSYNPARVHGSLDSNSILVDANLNAKVGNLLKIRQSPAQYLAPELLVGGGDPTMQSDVWSFGVLLYEIFSRKTPFEDVLLEDFLLEENTEGEEGAPCQTRSELPVLTLDSFMAHNNVVPSLCQDCQSADPNMRPTFEQICEQLAKVEMCSLANKLNTLLEEKKLLHDILPAHVAHDLALGKKVKPEVYPNITLFFSDIVGFTSISQQMEPMEVMSMLDRLYDEFDKLCKKHELFKVETIGDAYMCAGNLLKAQQNHAKIMVQFAVDTIRVANNTPVHLENPMGHVNIRVGLHSGSVVASVVGQTNPRYCLFGDTVNTASRMESLSQANCIHMSASTARQLHGSGVKLLCRGKLEVKGKGEMETFWLDGYDPQEHSIRIKSMSRFSRASVSSSASGAPHFNSPSRKMNRASKEPAEIRRYTDPGGDTVEIRIEVPLEGPKNAVILPTLDDFANFDDTAEPMRRKRRSKSSIVR